MFGDRDPAHYLSQLTTTTTPTRLLWLDCAAASTREHGMFVERWRCGVIGSTHWTSKRGERSDKFTWHDNSYELWKWADGCCKVNRRVVLFCYDLAYQLRVSRGLLALPQLGWTLDRIVLERTAAWALLRDDKRTLMLCDVKSFAPVEFTTLADDVMSTQVIERDIPAGDGFRHARCQYRATVVREATLQILNWIQGENLGPFRPTGSGQSYAAYRRRFMCHKLLVHDDMDRLQAERAAMWTGRCEAWRHGELNQGPYTELDMTAAYCRIAAECDVPTIARHGPVKWSAATVERNMDKHAVMAEVTVTTDIPLVPTRHAGRTLWPVGTFKTVLWEPELRLLFEHGCKVKVHRAWPYDTGPALQSFASWVLDGLSPQTQVYGLVPKRVLKHWSRCLVGRLGLRFRSWESFGWQPDADLQLVTYLDVDAGVSTDMLIAGHERLILSDMAESTESLPQIPGWVMSECRRRLWVAMMHANPDRIVYCDTDSLIIDANVTDDQLPHLCDLFGADWSRKGVYSRVVIHGPRNLATESGRRVSGLPLTARQVAPLEFTGQIMRSVKESMRAGELDCVTSIPRRFILDAPDMRRQHLSRGRTAPFEVQLTKPSGTE